MNKVTQISHYYVWQAVHYSRNNDVKLTILFLCVGDGLVFNLPASEAAAGSLRRSLSTAHPEVLAEQN